MSSKEHSIHIVFIRYVFLLWKYYTQLQKNYQGLLHWKLLRCSGKTLKSADLKK